MARLASKGDRRAGEKDVAIETFHNSCLPHGQLQHTNHLQRIPAYLSDALRSPYLTLARDTERSWSHSRFIAAVAVDVDLCGSRNLPARYRIPVSISSSLAARDRLHVVVYVVVKVCAVHDDATLIPGFLAARLHYLSTFHLEGSVAKLQPSRLRGPHEINMWYYNKYQDWPVFYCPPPCTHTRAYIHTYIHIANYIQQFHDPRLRHEKKRRMAYRHDG